jgi:NADPH:quinone reductase-like Zn-dependent oxidoreductase/aryl carrier-like protein/NADP-dependent 3-hydroxy acid dehydrogenase YdfG
MEQAVDLVTLKLEHVYNGATSAIVCLLQKLEQASKMRDFRDLDMDAEYAWFAGTIHLSRLHWFAVEKSLAESALSPDALRLVVRQPGMLQSLQWTNQNFREIKSDHVKMRMATVGMNFRDLLIAIGMIGSPKEDSEDVNLAGAEGAGYVTEIGSEVKHLQVGDRVLAFGSISPGFATNVERHSSCCVVVPERMTNEEAATLPTVYITVLYCLVDKANLQKGQSLLIHSAAGGVGIAAIHVARWLRAEIYVTVGTEAKVEFLHRELAIPLERIFRSRDTTFLDGIMQSTNGKGVDFVLNSLSGELLHASWKCVAPGGTMLEIGKRDAIGRGQLPMGPFDENRTFTSVDVSKLALYLPTTRRLLEQVVKLYEQGHIHPIRPISVFAASKTEETLRHMQQGQHWGKIIVQFSEKDALPLTPAIPSPAFRQGVSYLLVGGTGGLGKSIADWMVQHGARNLVFLSRSAGKSDADQAFFRQLIEGGCDVKYYSGDVTDPTIVKKLVDDADVSGLPIAGVMQMAMVLSNLGVLDMDLPTWNTPIRPKVDDTWNLHQLLPKDMDFFVLFSSVAGLCGSFGQANYASANTFLDAFVQYRQHLDLAASVIDIGPVDDIGFVANNQNSFGNVQNNFNLVSEQEFLNLLQLAVASSSSPKFGQSEKRSTTSFHNPSQIAQIPGCTLPIADPQNNTTWKRDPRMSIYRNIQKVSISDSNTEGSDILRAFIASLLAETERLEDKASADLLVRAIALRVSGFLMRDEKDVDINMNLAAAGVDSLVAIELRNWWKQSLGVEVSVLELMKRGSILSLGDMAVERLKEKHRSK